MSRPGVRTGVTLVEMVVALALFGIVAAIMLGALRGQQRFHTASLEIIDTRRASHQAAALLYGALRGASNTDLYAISDSSVALRATIGTGFICSIDTSRSIISLPGPRTARTTALSALLTTPRAGDSLLVFDPGTALGDIDDRWHVHVLTRNPGAGPCPPRPFGLASDVGEGAGMSLDIAPPLAADVRVGSPLRFFRPASYSLYQSTGASWMLGYSLCAAGTCTVRQPLSGPYLPFAGGGSGGLAFQYYDAGGAPTADPTLVARIAVTARARSASVLDFGHVRRQRYQDSLSVTIGLRNGS
jgi:prepilin-type N-terminal cleavage/methylation domain-containing protein